MMVAVIFIVQDMGMGQLIWHLEKLSELENIIPYFTDDDFDLTKVIKLATEILFSLGADFQIITLP